MVGRLTYLDVRMVGNLTYMDVRTETKLKKNSEEDILVLDFIVFQFGWSLKMAPGAGGGTCGSLTYTGT